MTATEFEIFFLVALADYITAVEKTEETWYFNEYNLFERAILASSSKWKDVIPKFRSDYAWANPSYVSIDLTEWCHHAWSLKNGFRMLPQSQKWDAIIASGISAERIKRIKETPVEKLKFWKLASLPPQAEILMGWQR